MNFSERVYALVRLIPPGRVATYGQIALMLGAPQASRAVGTALSRNPYGPMVPCHRVLNRRGEMASWGIRGTETQTRRLQDENVLVWEGRVDLTRYQWDGALPPGMDMPH